MTTILESLARSIGDQFRAERETGDIYGPNIKHNENIIKVYVYKYKKP